MLRLFCVGHAANFYAGINFLLENHPTAATVPSPVRGGVTNVNVVHMQFTPINTTEGFIFFLMLFYYIFYNIKIRD